MNSGHGSWTSKDDGAPRPSTNGIDSPFRLPSAEDSDPMALSPDELPWSEHPLSLRHPHQIITSLSRMSTLARHGSYTDDLESQAVISDDSIDNLDATPLANRTRRQNEPIPLPQIAAELRPSRAEELDGSAPVTSTSEEDMFMYESPHPLRVPVPRPEPFHPMTRATGLIPPHDRRQVYMRQDGMMAFAPSPPASSRGSPAVSTTASFSYPADYGYGYGYAGYDRSHFYVIEDLSNPRPVSDPTGLRPSRFVLFNPCVMDGHERVELQDQTEILEEQDQEFLFPGLSSDDGEPSLSGSLFEESPVHDAITVHQAPIPNGDDDYFMGGNGHVNGL